MQSSELEPILERYESLLMPNDLAFLRRVYNTDADIYGRRIEAIACSGLTSVLDAGCGFGQWTLALARKNQRVAALDSQSIRLAVLRELCEKDGIANVDIRCGSVSELPYADTSFDAVFSYGVVFCTDWHLTLSEFHRVLKPGGRLYLSANDIGYSLYLWTQAPNSTADYCPSVTAARNFQNTVNYKQHKIPPTSGQIIIPAAEMTAYLKQLGFKITGCGDEGTLDLAQTGNLPAPFFKGSYCNMPGCYEVVAEKN